MNITRSILKWTDEQTEKLTGEKKSDYVKALGLGMIEGAVDGAVLAYPIVLAGCLYWKKQATKK